MKAERVREAAERVMEAVVKVTEAMVMVVEEMVKVVMVKEAGTVVAAMGVVVVRTYCIGACMRPANQSPVCRMPTTGSKAMPRIPYSRFV